MGTMIRRASSMAFKPSRRGACERSRIVILASSEVGCWWGRATLWPPRRHLSTQFVVTCVERKWPLGNRYRTHGFESERQAGSRRRPQGHRLRLLHVPTDPGIEAGPAGAGEHEPSEEQQQAPFRQIEEVQEAPPRRGDVVLRGGRGGDRHDHDSAQHERRRARDQADDDQRAADELDARHERRLQLGERDAEGAKVLDESRELAELAEPLAEELDTDRETNHESPQPLDAVEPRVEPDHEVGGVSHALSSLAAKLTSQPSLLHEPAK